MPDLPDSVPNHKKARSRISNDVMHLPGCDGRSSRSRRYRDIVASLMVTFGKEAPDAIRELATIKLSLEDAQAEALKGDAKAREAIVRLSNLASRKEASLRLRGRQKANRGGVAGHIAAKGFAKA